MNYKNKYIKYKEKYINLKKIIGGEKNIMHNLTWEIINDDEYIINNTKYYSKNKVINDNGKYKFDGDIRDKTNNKLYNVKFDDAIYNIHKTDFEYNDFVIKEISNNANEKIFNDFFNNQTSGKMISFIKKYLTLSPHNINYISFILYNDLPALTDYLNDNYCNIDKIISNTQRIKNTVNGNIIDIDSNIFIKKIHDVDMIYSTILKYAEYKHTEHYNNKRTEALDNIYIEFLNGLCINKFKKKSPNWIKTYSCVLFENKYNDVNILKNIIKIINNTDIKTNFFEDICNKKYNSAIIIEKINNTISFNDLIQNITIRQEFYNMVFDKNYDINKCNEYIMDYYCILIQIYAALNLNNKTFTHHDLHLNNVLLIKDPFDKKFSFIYTYNNKKIKIYSNYIAIIIDYGRSYVSCENASTKLFNKYQKTLKKYLKKMLPMLQVVVFII